MAPRLTDEELSQLTDEEREGYLEDLAEDEAGEGEDSDDAVANAAAELAEEEDEFEDADSDDEEQAAQPDAQPEAAAATPQPQEQQQAAEQATDEAATGEQDDDDVTPSWMLPADIAAKEQELNAKLDEIAERFDDGDMDAKQMRAEERAVREELDELKTRRIVATVAKDAAVKQWVEGDVAGFMAEHPEYQAPGFLRDALDAEVKKLQASAANPLNPKILEKAHQAIAKQIDGAFKVNREAKPAPTPAKGEKKALPKRSDPPPTLAQIPASDAIDVNDGEFGHLDQMISRGDSIGYEKALAALPEAKRDQYLAQG